MSTFIGDGFCFGDVVSSDLLLQLKNEVLVACQLGDERGREGEVDRLFELTLLQQKLPHTFLLSEIANNFASKLIGREAELIMSQLVVRKSGSMGVPFHVDGRPTVKTWNEMPFCQVIVGVPLTEVNTRQSGNLIYKQGAHLTVCNFIKKNITRFLEMDKDVAFREVYDFVRNLDMPQLALNWSPGQMYAMHALLPHGVEENQNAERPVWYFRFGNPMHKGATGFNSAFKGIDWPIILD